MACENLLKLGGRLLITETRAPGRCSRSSSGATSSHRLLPRTLRCTYGAGRNIRTEGQEEREKGMQGSRFVSNQKHFRVRFDSQMQINTGGVSFFSLSKQQNARFVAACLTESRVKRGLLGFGATRIWQRGWKDETRKASRPHKPSIFLSWMRRTARSSSRIIFSDRFNAFRLFIDWQFEGGGTNFSRRNFGAQDSACPAKSSPDRRVRQADTGATAVAQKYGLHNTASTSSSQVCICESESG